MGERSWAGGRWTVGQVRRDAGVITSAATPSGDDGPTRGRVWFGEVDGHRGEDIDIDIDIG